MKQPEWIDRPPDQWPPEARIVYGILAIGAERLLKAEAERAMPGPVAEVPIEERMAVFLCDLLQHGPVEAHRLDARLATQYGLSISKATETRRRLGFVPAFKGGPIVAPKGV